MTDSLHATTIDAPLQLLLRKHVAWLRVLLWKTSSANCQAAAASEGHPSCIMVAAKSDEYHNHKGADRDDG